jgi:hypothetical protein
MEFNFFEAAKIKIQRRKFTPHTITTLLLGARAVAKSRDFERAPAESRDKPVDLESRLSRDVESSG